MVQIKQNNRIKAQLKSARMSGVVLLWMETLKATLTAFLSDS